MRVLSQEGLFMLQSRRGFLIGAGSLLTTAFVKDARSFIGASGRPLLVPPKQVLQTLSWRNFFIEEGIRHETAAEIENTCEDYGIELKDFDDPVDAYYWQQRFDTEGDPCAMAHHLLCNINFGPNLGTAKSPQLEFHSGGGALFDNSLWVNAKDKLSLSLLQARLIDLEMPIRVAEGGAR
jgi:hypothetical protein